MIEEGDARDLRAELAQALILAGYERVIADAVLMPDATDEEDYGSPSVGGPEALALLRLVDAISATFIAARDLPIAIVENLKEFDVRAVLVAPPDDPSSTTVLVSVEEGQEEDLDDMIALLEELRVLVVAP